MSYYGGLDVARSGEDETVLAIRRENVVLPLFTWALADTMVTAGRVIQVLRMYPVEQLVIDVNGIGAGVYDRLREQDYPVIPFHPSAKIEEKDSTGMLEFVNLRAYAWWYFREIVDPRFSAEVCLPDDDRLLEDLVAPRYKTMSSGRIQLEDKEAIKKRLQRSPDRGDAVVMCFYPGGRGTFEETFKLYTPKDVEEIRAWDEARKLAEGQGISEPTEEDLERVTEAHRRYHREDAILSAGNVLTPRRKVLTPQEEAVKLEAMLWQGADQMGREDSLW